MRTFLRAAVSRLFFEGKFIRFCWEVYVMLSVLATSSQQGATKARFASTRLKSVLYSTMHCCVLLCGNNQPTNCLKTFQKLQWFSLRVSLIEVCDSVNLFQRLNLIISRSLGKEYDCEMLQQNGSLLQKVFNQLTLANISKITNI